MLLFVNEASLKDTVKTREGKFGEIQGNDHSLKKLEKAHSKKLRLSTGKY